MKTALKKILSVILTVCIVSSAFVFGAAATETSVSSFSEFVAAVSDAALGDTIVLSADITADSTVTVSGNITIDGNGNSIIRSSSFAGQVLKVEGTLTLQNVTLNGNRTSTAVSKLASEIIYMASGSELNLNDGTVITVNRADASAHTGGIWMDGGTLNMYKGAELSDLHQHNTSTSTPAYGTAVNIMSGTFNMYGGKITSCDGRTGAVGNIGGTFNMYGGTISDNIANSSGVGGGGVYNEATFNMYGGTISSNTSWVRGGGVYNAGVFNLYDGTLTKNIVLLADSTSCEGAAICTVGTFNMENGTISFNTAQNCGGGIQINGGTATISGGIISSNTAQVNSGGGVFVGGDATLTMTGGSITSNSAAQYGGALAVTSTAANALVITGGEIYDNTCGTSQCGSDIYVTTATATAMTQFGDGCIVYNLYLDNTDSRYSETSKTLAPSSALTAGYGYKYVTNGASHSFGDWVETIPSSCETTGLMERVCSLCSAKEEKITSPKGHNTISETIEATCSEDGLFKLYCPVCGYIHMTSVIPATGHIAGNLTALTLATEEQNGTAVKRCIHCGEIMESTEYAYSNDAAVSITVGEPVIVDENTSEVTVSVNVRNNPGVWGMGLYVYYSDDLRVSSVSNGSIFGDDDLSCEAINVSVASDTVAKALFKDGGYPVVDTLYTCLYAENNAISDITTDGDLITLTFRYSSSLEGSYTLGIAYDADNIINSDADNVNFITEDSTLDIRPAAPCDHVLDDWTVTVEPGFTAGERVRKCIYCGRVIEREELPPIYVTEITVDSVEASAGSAVDVSLSLKDNPGICGLRLFVYYSEDIEVTSVSNGTVFTNSEMNETELNIYPADNYAAKAVFEAAGIDTSSIKAHCIYFETSNCENIDANGTLITLTFSLPQNAKDSYHIGIVADDVINSSVQTVAVKYNEGDITVSEDCAHPTTEIVVLKPATCTEEGISAVKCTVCGNILSESTIPLEAHDFEDEYTIDVAATRTTAGVKSRHCRNCTETTDETAYYIVRLGDVTGDGRVNSKDVVLLKKYVANQNYSGTIVKWNSDINSDKRINSKDVVTLKKQIAVN